MCSPALDPPANMTPVSSDEQVISYFHGFKPGSLPPNVLEDINPFQYRPSNLPDGMWYMVDSTEKKENEYGFWEAKEEASEVFTNSSISGWRKTLEYFEFDNLEKRTDWVMQEYSVTHKEKCGANSEKEMRVLCKIFLSTTMKSGEEEHYKSKAAGIEGKNHSPTVPLIAPNPVCISGKDSAKESLMKTGFDVTTLFAEDAKLRDPQRRDILEEPLYGDYLELDDLVDPLSHSSSSNISGRTSMTSDEYFDPVALLNALKDNTNQGQQGKDSSRCVTASIRPFEVVMQPPMSRPLVSDTVKQQPSRCKQASSVIETKFLDERLVNCSVKKVKANRRDDDPLFPHGVVASSSSATAMPISAGKKEAAVVKTKRLKKYFCFCPF